MIGLTKNNERISCLPLKLVPCASSSLSQQSVTGASRPTVRVQFSFSFIILYR